ncbi:MAG: type II toxin-antitoxin system RelE/ParE family toxin [Segetibacter sp.]
MVWIIKIRPLAYEDLDDIILWYDRQRQGLGHNFLIEFDKSVERLRVSPQAYGIIFNPVRTICLKRFPYKVLFIINSYEIIILGIVHHKVSNRYLNRYK